MRVMVVDDSRAMRTILKRVLTECGFDDIGEAGHGGEGLAVLAAGALPSVVLVDWNMPQMNGIEFVRAVRANSAYDGVALIMITTETAIERIQEALSAGANEYIMKPFTKDVLLEKLDLAAIQH